MSIWICYDSNIPKTLNSKTAYKNKLTEVFEDEVVALNNSRKLVLEKSDWIIPGHGKKFKSPARLVE